VVKLGYEKTIKTFVTEINKLHDNIFGLDNELDIDYTSDGGRRIFIFNDNKEWSIRTWDISESLGSVYIRYSIFAD
jgi:hypothetical protein